MKKPHRSAKSREASRGRWRAWPAILACALLCSCAESRCDREEGIQSRYKDSARLNETAAFIAGLELAPDSDLKLLAETEDYRRYRAAISAIWEGYRRRELLRIQSWSHEHLATAEGSLVFYPFSGPDILNALAFFPEAGELLMVGLEIPGGVPDPRLIARRRLAEELGRVRYSLRTLLQLNLFRTAEMMSDLRPGTLAGVCGVMMFFLARSGYRIMDMRPVCLSGHSAGPSPCARGAVPGIELVFRKGRGHPLRTARYFRLDLSDSSLRRDSGLAAYIQARGPCVTFIKSASYLLHFDNFSVLRNLILSRSGGIVQDDTGVPYRFFAGEEWELSFYGNYRVLAMFSGRMQRDLAAEMKRRSAGALPFSFGYGFIPQKSNIMIAQRKAGK